MGHFAEYLMERQSDRIAAVLVAAEIDVDKFCEDVIAAAEKESLIAESNLLLELGNRNSLGGLSSLASTTAGVAGLGNMARDVARPVGSTFGEFGRSLGSLGRTLGTAAKRAWDSTGGKVVQNAGNYMAQSSQSEKLRQAQNAVFALNKQLQGYGYKDDFLNKTFEPLMKAIQADMDANKNLGHRIGSQPATTQTQTQTTPATPTQTTRTQAPETQSNQISPTLSAALDKALAANPAKRRKPVGNAVNPLATAQFST